jgi:16S rRNA (cytosine967-C5)-methyltransferase
VQKTQQAAARAIQLVLSGQNLTNALATARTTHSFTEQEQAALQAYSFGTLRHLGLLRFMLDELVTRKPKNPDVTALLLVALYQLEFGKAPHYAVVDHAVKSINTIAGQGLKSFANAVLREYLRKREALLDAASKDDVARLSYPRWWIEKLRSQIGAQAEPVLASGNKHPPMTLRVNRRLVTPEEYVLQLEAHQIKASTTGASAVILEQPLSVHALPGFGEGVVSVQDAGAQLSAPLLDLQARQTVVDACAAPGGKTGHILELADVQLTALDHQPERLARVADNLNRLHFEANLCAADATQLEAWWNGKPVDRVLLDVPCSASGVVRRHPDVKWLRRSEDIEGFVRQQRRLLDALWRVVAGGGKLLYVTCSVFREENQDQVRQFLSSHADARLAARHANSGGELLLPNEEHDGFFHALFEKA